MAKHGEVIPGDCGVSLSSYLWQELCRERRLQAIHSTEIFLYIYIYIYVYLVRLVTGRFQGELLTTFTHYGPF